MLTLLIPALILAVLPIGGLAAQSMVVLDPDRDNTLYESTGVQLSNGSGDRIFAGVTLQIADNLRRALIRFDVAGAVPPGSTVTDVSFTAKPAILRGGGRTMSLHAVLADWGEGASVAGGGQGAGTSAAPGDATWLNRFFPGQPWGIPGGDFRTSASAQLVNWTGGTLTIASTPTLVADVQGWLDDPSTNFGWLLKSDELSAGDSAAFHSRESTRPPVLAITYMPPQAAARSYGIGCAGSSSTVLGLSANGLPSVPNTGFSVSLSGGVGAPGEVVFISALGLPNGFPIGRIGCSVYIDLNGFLLGVAADANRTVALPVPMVPDLIGLRLFLQGAAVDRGVLATSNGLELLLGV